MNVFSTITGYLNDVFNGGSKTVAIHQSVEGGKPQTSMSGFAPGLEINPADGENIVITKIKGSSSFVVSIGGTNQNIEPTTERGERKLYAVSEDGLEEKGSLHLKNDGSISLKNDNGSYDIDSDGKHVINEGTVSAVLYDGLETAYNAVNDKLNDLITKYNSHIHITTATVSATPVPGIISPTVSVETPSTGDITPAESADIKLS